MTDSFVFYRSFYEATKKLPPDVFKEAVCAICEYGLNEVDSRVNSAIAEIIFTMAKPQLSANKKKAINGAKGGRPKKPLVSEEKTIGFEKNENQKPNGNGNINGNIKETLPKGSVKKSSAFQAPTLEEIENYVLEKGYNNVDCQRFFDFYESKGWFVGKNKMKDWRAAVRNWSRSQREEKTAKAKNITNFKQRDNNYELLQEQLLERGL